MAVCNMHESATLQLANDVHVREMAASTGAQLIPHTCVASTAGAGECGDADTWRRRGPQLPAPKAASTLTVSNTLPKQHFWRPWYVPGACCGYAMRVSSPTLADHLFADCARVMPRACRNAVEWHSLGSEADLPRGNGLNRLPGAPTVAHDLFR